MFEREITKYLDSLVGVLSTWDLQEIDNAIELISHAWHSQSQILVCGNGGSALTASHYVTDWNKGIFSSTGKQFYGRCLSDNQGIVTAYANDVSFDEVYAEQVRSFGKDGDLLIAISGSGNSKNIINAINAAKLLGMQTLGICGFPDGKMLNLCDVVLCSNVHDMQLAEDTHLIFGHLVFRMLCEKI